MLNIDNLFEEITFLMEKRPNLNENEMLKLMNLTKLLTDDIEYNYFLTVSGV